MTVDVERMADFLAEPSAERIALNKEMETEPAREERQDEQDRDQDQKTSAFHANEIMNCGIELVSVAGRRLSRLFGDPGGDRKTESGVRSCRSQELQEFRSSESSAIRGDCGVEGRRAN